MKDYYKILDLPTACSIKEIRSKYRLLVKKWHPDVNPDTTARDRTIEIIEAYGGQRILHESVGILSSVNG